MSADSSKESEASAPRRPGRRPSADVRRRILAAASELLSSVGFLDLTMDGVAGRAGVTRKTLYHWWPGKAALVGELIVAESIVDEVPDTGSTREELLILLGQIVRDVAPVRVGGVLPVLWASMGDREVMERYRREVVSPRRRLARAAVQRGIARGDLPADTDVDLLIDQWSGTVMFRQEVRGDDLYQDQIEQLVAVALAGGVPRLPGSGRVQLAVSFDGGAGAGEDDHETGSDEDSEDSPEL